jgi:hypothetical protein
VTSRRWAVPFVLLAIATAGCGPQPPDYKSIWTTSTTTTTTNPNGEPPVPMSTYLESVGVTGDPVEPEKLTDLTVTLPRPKGWQQYSSPSLAPGTRVITKGSGYPNATLVTYRLTGTLDVNEALTHADAEAEVSQNFKKLNGSKNNFHGFPSSMIEGSYDLSGQRMQSYNRVVFARGKPAKPGDQGALYLITLTVTSFENEAAKYGPDIEDVIKGFTVTAKP